MAFKTVTKEPETTNTAPNPLASLASLIDGDSVDVIRPRYLYKHEIKVKQKDGTEVVLRNSTPLAGYPIDIVQFNSKLEDNTDPYDNILIRTTSPTQVLALNGQDFMEVPEGSDVLVRANKELESIAQLAMNATELRQVAIMADKKISIKNGTQTLWELKARVSKKTYARADIAPETLQAAQPAAQLNGGAPTALAMP